MWGELWEALATGRVGQHLYLSYAFAFVLFFVAIALPHPIDGLFACLFPLASCFILKSCASEPQRRPTSAPLHLQDVPFKQFIAFIVLLSTLWGVSQKIAPQFITPASSTFFLAESMFVAGVAASTTWLKARGNKAGIKFPRTFCPIKERHATRRTTSRFAIPSRPFER